MVLSSSFPSSLLLILIILIARFQRFLFAFPGFCDELLPCSLLFSLIRENAFTHRTLYQYFILLPSNEKKSERQGSPFLRQVPTVWEEWQISFCSGSCNLPQSKLQLLLSPPFPALTHYLTSPHNSKKHTHNSSNLASPLNALSTLGCPLPQ